MAERTVLLAAADQKSILYFNLFADPADTAINPCHIRSVDDESMTVVSPRGNRLNDAAPGQKSAATSPWSGPTTKAPIAISAPRWSR